MKKQILTSVALSALVLLPASAQSGLLQKYARQLTEPRHYVCYRTTEKMKIDGKLNEAAWAKAAPTESFVDISGEGFPKPAYDTKARLLWDDNYLYISAVLEEPNIVARLTQRDTIIYHDNDFEVFLDPDCDLQNYFEIENNARGVVFDLMLDRSYRSGGNFMIQWDCPGLQLAVSHNGTLNRQNDTDRSWTVEMAIPHKAVSVNFDKPLQAGRTWRLNFSRVQWMKKGGPEENWVWTPTGKIDMHMPDRWGFLQFSDKAVGTATDAFTSPYEMRAYRLLWAIFYAELAHRSAHGAFTSSTDVLGLTAADYASLPQGCNVEVESTSQSFQVSIRVPEAKSRYVVDQNGKFSVQQLAE